jgi:hypothetical protein
MPLEFEDASRLPKLCIVFYCWQDHADKKLHRFLIRDAVLSAISKVQDEIPDEVDCTLSFDSDTLGRTGSVDIADTILAKIDASSILIADVTPTLVDAAKDRFYPNPNVMLEVGHASKALGWNRLICVFNEAVCSAEKLPFDIRHRRVTPFLCKEHSQKKEALKHLEGILVVGIRAILQDMARPSVDKSLGDPIIKRRRDVLLLRQMMNTVHRPTLDRYIEMGLAQQLHYDCTFFFEGFHALVVSSKFRFYDQILQKLVIEFDRLWHATVHHGGYAFGPAERHDGFVLKPNHLWSEDYTETVEAMGKAYQQLPKAFAALLDHVHHNYPEVDMDETDKKAWEDNLPYIRGDHFKKKIIKNKGTRPGKK